MIIESKNMRQNFGVEIIDPDTIINLKKVHIPKISMQGSPWY